ncbi:MAG: hypothetical protein SF123_09635 [Chloroflexota bacterium]|nr:hypothetical protein [Chloroflexota bacterium]
MTRMIEVQRTGLRALPVGRAQHWLRQQFGQDVISVSAGDDTIYVEARPRFVVTPAALRDALIARLPMSIAATKLQITADDADSTIIRIADARLQGHTHVTVSMRYEARDLQGAYAKPQLAPVGTGNLVEIQFTTAFPGRYILTAALVDASIEASNITIEAV